MDGTIDDELIENPQALLGEREGVSGALLPRDEGRGEGMVLRMVGLRMVECCSMFRGASHHSPFLSRSTPQCSPLRHAYHRPPQPGHLKLLRALRPGNIPKSPRAGAKGRLSPEHHSVQVCWCYVRSGIGSVTHGETCAGNVFGSVWIPAVS